ncbi:hypothetical protein [Clostridium sp. DJ247]|uniref:hypothetical protein n=1 Tax=Clostridium sp. DJ247 TaxID=2726188 RepID=UPI001626068D|nr:hypothetical protein [Clostridium sp. DJ247]MBC2582254.1 hypothetical protein [Clostridium sp. DJ247]
MPGIFFLAVMTEIFGFILVTFIDSTGLRVLVGIYVYLNMGGNTVTSSHLKDEVTFL